MADERPLWEYFALMVDQYVKAPGGPTGEATFKALAEFAISHRTPIRDALQANATADGEIWVWFGGDNPVGDALVKIWFRDGREFVVHGDAKFERDGEMHRLDWKHLGNGGDIVAFRIVRNTPPPHQGR